MRRITTFRLFVSCIVAGLILAGISCQQTPKYRGKAKFLVSPAPFSMQMMDARLAFLGDYLTKETGWKVDMIGAPVNMESFVKMVETEKVAFSLQNTYFYFLLAEKEGAVPVLKTISLEGRAEYRGLIVCRGDSRIKSLNDLRGKEVLATSRFHVGGFLSQWLLLKEQGFDPDQDLAFRFGNTQEEILDEVASGRAEVGFIREDVLQAVIKAKGQLPRVKVIDTTPYYPSTCIVKYPGTDPDLAQKVATALIKLNFNNPSDRFILERLRISGFAPASPDDYSEFQRLLTSYGLFPPAATRVSKTGQAG